MEKQKESRLAEEKKWAARFHKEGKVAYETAGPFALFADPATSYGGEKCTLEIPTHEAMKRFTGNIFWKPAIEWKIDRIRVMNPIRTMAVGQRLLGIRGDIDRAYYTYLINVRYQVEAHFEFNKNHPEMTSQWDNPHKFYSQFVRAAMAEGRRAPFFGKSECIPSYIRLCRFGEGKGHYDGKGEHRFGLMYYGLTYADEAYDDVTSGKLTQNSYIAVMKDGIVEFPHPSECFRHTVGDCGIKTFLPKKE